MGWAGLPVRRGLGKGEERGEKEACRVTWKTHNDGEQGHTERVGKVEREGQERL